MSRTPTRARQVLLDLVPDPPSPVGQHRDLARVADRQPAGGPPPLRSQPLGGADHRAGDPLVGSGQSLVVPRVEVPNRLAPPTLGEDRQSDLPPAADGVDAGPIGLELDIALGLAERSARLGILALPDAHPPPVVIADLADRVVPDDQPGDVPEVAGAALERPLGPDQAEQPLRLRADEPLQAEPLVERMRVHPAPAAGEVDPLERHVPGGGDEPPLSPAVVL